MSEYLPGPGLALRPGICVVRRDDRHLQVGVDAPLRVVLPDDPDVRRVLEALCVGARPHPRTSTGRHALLTLLDAGLAVDADGLDRRAVATATAAFGPDGAERVARRALVGVDVVARPEMTSWARGLLTDLGVGTDPSAEQGVSLVIGESWLARERFDDLLRTGRPHLLVGGAVGWPVLGPFVVPGVTACVRCVDAHLGEADPRRSMIVEQVARQQIAGDGPLDPALHAMAVAWAVRDVVALIDGDLPSTWSATVHLGADLSPQRREWARHPHCGCAWDEMPAAG